MATIKQMAARANPGHLQVLKAAVEGRSLAYPGMTLGTARGYQVCAETLVRWGCLVRGQVSATGLELMAALQKKWEPQILNLSR